LKKSRIFFTREMMRFGVMLIHGEGSWALCRWIFVIMMH
jgi:hypothetical protein